MPAKRKPASKRRRSSGGGNISPILVFLLALMGVAAIYCAYLELGNSDVPDAAVDSFISRDADLEIHYIDVGQGDCSLILWEGASVLIDCGEKDYSQTVLDYLEAQGVEKLDYIVTTHPHSDHMGGMSEIIANIDAGRVIAPRVSEDMTPTSKTYENFLSALRDKGLRLTAAKPGTVYTLEGKTTLSAEKQAPTMEILAPVEDYDDLNNYSVVVKLRYGSTSYLFTGDIEKKAEKDILAAGADVSADVLKVAHHGSSSSSSEAFFTAVSPSICVIQCGEGNSYGHPHAETLERISQSGAQCYRTDLRGTVVVYSDGTEIFVKTEKGDEDADN